MSDESYSGGEEEREEPAKAATVGAKAEDRRKSGGKAVPSMSSVVGRVSDGVCGSGGGGAGPGPAEGGGGGGGGKKAGQSTLKGFFAKKK